MPKTFKTWCILGRVAALLVGLEFAGPGWATGAEPIPIREYRDTNPTIDLVDPVRVLSGDKAQELQAEIQSAYAKLAPSVVRIWLHDDQGKAFNENGTSTEGSYSGVIIDPAGLILTCSHHGLAPDTAVTVELADGKRVAGKTLGRFQLSDPQPGHYGPDIGLVQITERNDFVAAKLKGGERTNAGQICLALGYPGELAPARPPLLRVGRIVPEFTGWGRLEATVTGIPGDSGGPLFDLQGRVLGVRVGGDVVGTYQSIAPLESFRQRLESGELVAAPSPHSRALRARYFQPAAFTPALDVEDRVLQMQSSVIRIMDGTHTVAAGLIVDPEGWAVTKASLVGSREQWTCRAFFTRNGALLVKGRVVAVSKEHDVALLKLETSEWPVAKWAEERPIVGTFVVSVHGRTTGPVQVAVVGSEADRDLAKENDIPSVLIEIQPGSSGEPVVKDVASSPEFDSFRDLVQPGDVITHINDVPTPSAEQYGRVTDRLHYALEADGHGVDYSTPAPGSFCGDLVRVGIRRGSVETTVRVPRIHSSNIGALAWYSHPLSLRRESFPAVFAHDGVLSPEQCGGPVVDLSGRVAGLNIARADGTRTLAIPADVLQTVIDELRTQAAEARH